ncbi:MAG: YbhB/YbcL family Raf kinase inhibitor-like protein [Candidatus Cohnella colombiensis]|uniref:YbhB/YbcL family Raf kinase inhibitor-like protein n=1 Tax=Candidatus Cohnella colombiensis TaxID=3121368 RepID=A0AA95EW23_9BACL|nr:MAG: YbhB/YbcL family Raf kinase inhibitor-like protein [Cohnella sp.]
MKIKDKNLVKGNMTLSLMLIFAFVLTLVGCSGKSNESDETETAQAQPEPAQVMPFQLTSSAFEDGGRIDIKYTYTNKNLSVPLAWGTPPEGTKSLALFMVDLHPVAGNWVHWVIANMPADTRELSEGVSKTEQIPPGSLEIKNSFGTVGFGGPQPPVGSGDHEYKFILYALNVESIELMNRVSYERFQEIVKDNVIASVELSGFYENK